MTMLEHIDLLSTPQIQLVEAINSLKARGNPMQDTSRRHDLDLLVCTGKLITPRRVCLGTGNALLMLLLQNLPDSCTEISLARKDLAHTTGTVLPHLAGKITTDTTNPDNLETALVIDVMDLFEHAEQIRTELNSGSVTQVWIHCTLLSYAREWMAHAGDDLFEHFPFSRGFSGANLDRAQCRALSDALDACANESRWYPSRIGDALVKSAKLDPGAMLALAKTIGDARQQDDGTLLCGLSKRVGRLLEDIWDGIQVAIPHVDMSPPPQQTPWTNKWKKDAVAVAKAVESFFNDHPQRDHLIVMMGENHARAIHLANELIDSRNPFKPHATMKSIAKLAGLLFQIREQIWWMRDWDAPNNQTWEIIVKNKCPVGTLGPKPVKPLKEYLDLYWYEGARSAERMKSRRNQPVIDRSNPPSSRRIKALGHLNHTARKIQAVDLCSLMLYRLGAQFPDEKIRWLDVGCGNGNIANAVHIPDWLEDRIEIIGLDFGEGMIRHANQRAAKNRRYVVANALAPPEELMGMRFHMVSTFEFLEHLIDPVALLRNYATLKPEIMVGGSPLGEPQPWLPARAHTWSFKREGYEALFKEAGMKITYSSEVRIGTYLGGHDWVTVAGAFGEGLRPALPQKLANELTALETTEEYKPTKQAFSVTE